MRDILQSRYLRRRVAHKQLARTSLRRLIVFLKCPTNNKSDTVLDKNLVLSNEIDKGGFAGSRWELGPNDAQRECVENVE